MIAGQFKLHAERGGSSGRTPKLGVVVHDSEGSENSEQLIRFCAAPGDRDNGRGGKYGGGYNAVATEDGFYYEVAGGDRSPYHAPPLNSVAWSICIPGRASRTRDQWLTGNSRQYIRGVARFIVDKWQVDGRRWPLVMAEPELLHRAAGTPPTGPFGLTQHRHVSQTWHQTDHTDPGPNFPDDVLLADIKELLSLPGPIAGFKEEQTVVIGGPATGGAPAVRIPASGNGDTVIRILRSMTDPPEFYAQFIAVTDAEGHSIEVQWTGSGDDPRVQRRIQALRDAGVQDEHITVAGLQQNRLHCRHKPSDIADALRAWTDNDFAV